MHLYIIFFNPLPPEHVEAFFLSLPPTASISCCSQVVCVISCPALVTDQYFFPSPSLSLSLFPMSQVSDAEVAECRERLEAVKKAMPVCTIAGGTKKRGRKPAGSGAAGAKTAKKTKGGGAGSSGT